MEEIITELNKILPIVARVHGDHHPELHEIKDLYLKAVELIEKNDNEQVKELLEKCCELSNGFTTPADGCPTYEKTYRDLALLKNMFE